MQATSKSSISSVPSKTASVQSKSAQIKAIREAFSELVRLNLQDGFREVSRYLLEKNLAAERQHRKGAPYGIRHGISANDAAKLFVVQHLLEGFAEPDKWAVDDILSIRTEVLYAQAYAKRFHKQLDQWAAKYTETFKAIDYANLMQSGR
jgi:hypothetical protein